MGTAHRPFDHAIRRTHGTRRDHWRNAGPPGARVGITCPTLVQQTASNERFFGPLVAIGPSGDRNGGERTALGRTIGGTAGPPSARVGITCPTLVGEGSWSSRLT